MQPPLSNDSAGPYRRTAAARAARQAAGLGPLQRAERVHARGITAHPRPPVLALRAPLAALPLATVPLQAHGPARPCAGSSVAPASGGVLYAPPCHLRAVSELPNPFAARFSPPPLTACVLGNYESFIPPGLAAGVRRKRLASVRAAHKLVDLFSIHEAANALTLPAIVSWPRERVDVELVEFLARWDASTLDGAFRVRRKLRAFQEATGRDLPVGGVVSGLTVAKFIDAEDAAARAKWRAKHPHGDPTGRAACGGQAKRGNVKGVKWLAKNLGDAIDVLAPIAVKAMRLRKRRGVAAPSMSLRMQANLEHMSKHGTTEFERGLAGGLAGMNLFAIRHVNAQRSYLGGVSGGIVRGVCDSDAKVDASDCNPRPMCTSELGILGDRAWLDALLAMLSGFEHHHALLRACNHADPAKATAWCDHELSNAATKKLIVLLLTRGPYAVSTAVAARITPHSPKHFLPCVARALGFPEPAINEIGRWSGSVSQDAEHAEAAQSGFGGGADSMPLIYSDEAAVEIAGPIMLKAVAGARALIARVGAAALPESGGWALLHPFAPGK